jgi:hypothetical protein
MDDVVYILLVAGTRPGGHLASKLDQILHMKLRISTALRTASAIRRSASSRSGPGTRFPSAFRLVKTCNMPTFGGVDDCQRGKTLPCPRRIANPRRFDSHPPRAG